jgi:hypothetical protein
VSCQLSASIATSVATAVVRFEATDVAVDVTTDCIPPMSLVIRDCTSPVRVRGEEADGLALQVGEDVGAQAVHDPLADRRRDPGLHDPSAGGHGGDGDHADDEPDQQRQVLVGQGVVDDGAQQERRGHGHRRRHDDQRGDAGDGAVVRGEQARDAPQRDLAACAFLRCGDGGPPGRPEVALQGAAPFGRALVSIAEVTSS